MTQTTTTSSSSIKDDLGRLLLRLPIGGLMLFHGVHKLLHGHDGIREMLAQHGLPQVLWLGVPVGEVLAPALILLGAAVRLSSALVAFTMLASIYLGHGLAGFALGSYGGLKAELNLLYLFGALALAFLGSGRYSVYRGGNRWLQ